MTPVSYFFAATSLILIFQNTDPNLPETKNEEMLNNSRFTSVKLNLGSSGNNLVNAPAADTCSYSTSSTKIQEQLTDLNPEMPLELEPWMTEPGKWNKIID